MQGMAEGSADIIDWAHFEKARGELGPGFIRILSYFREDGVKSVAAIEQAMREENTVALVMPAHTIKGEARQFGAEPLAKAAELIESTARLCIETRRFPDESTKGAVLYAFMRSMQMRFMRIPKAQVKIGQKLPEHYR